jgi:hypothetical protein
MTTINGIWAVIFSAIAIFFAIVGILAGAWPLLLLLIYPALLLYYFSKQVGRKLGRCPDCGKFGAKIIGRRLANTQKSQKWLFPPSRPYHEGIDNLTDGSVSVSGDLRTFHPNARLYNVTVHTFELTKKCKKCGKEWTEEEHHTTHIPV